MPDGTLAPEVETQARSMGWAPKDTWRGDPEKWVDAQEFVRRGEEVLPIVKAENRKLHEEVSNLRNLLTESQKAIQESKESIEALQEFYTEETARQVEVAKTNLKAQLVAAREAGDVDAEAEILGQLGEIRVATQAAEKKAAAPPPPKATPAPQAVDPSFAPWQAKNAWFGTDKMKTRLAMGFAEDIRHDPAFAEVKGADFYDEISKRVADFYSERRPSSKVEDGAGYGGGSGGDRKKTYDDLPADAKAACERQAPKLVGPNRAHKTMKSWQESYAKTFFATE